MVPFKNQTHTHTHSLTHTLRPIPICRTLEVRKVRFHQHSGSYSLPPKSVEFVGDTHPVAYVAHLHLDVPSPAFVLLSQCCPAVVLLSFSCEKNETNKTLVPWFPFCCLGQQIFPLNPESPSPPQDHMLLQQNGHEGGVG